MVKKIKKESGITLIALITTILVLMIISTPIIMKTSNAKQYKQFTMFKKDLLNLKEAVENVYSTDKVLSSDPNSDMYIGPEYKDWQTFINNVNNKQQSGNSIINPNDKQSTSTEITYLVIDFKTLSKKFKASNNISLKKLNFGVGNKSLDTTTDDVYIINIQSRTIYYVKGFTLNDITYYRYQEHYTSV